MDKTWKEIQAFINNPGNNIHPPIGSLALGICITGGGAIPFIWH
jgi:hypothetical protein